MTICFNLQLLQMGERFIFFGIFLFIFWFFRFTKVDLQKTQGYGFDRGQAWVDRWARRSHAGSAFLGEDARELDNLNITTEAEVLRILVDGSGTATGVVFEKGGVEYQVGVTHEVSDNYSLSFAVFNFFF